MFVFGSGEGREPGCFSEKIVRGFEKGRSAGCVGVSRVPTVGNRVRFLGASQGFIGDGFDDGGG